MGLHLLAFNKKNIYENLRGHLFLKINNPEEDFQNVDNYIFEDGRFRNLKRGR